MMRRIGWPIVILLLTLSCAPVKMVKLPQPFKSTPDEEKNVDRLLARWEQWNAGAKTFDCRFKRWIYDKTFGPANEPKFVDLGTIKYAAPDYGLYRLDTAEKDGKEYSIEDARAEHWVFDGKSLTECNYVRRQIIEHKLPPDFQGTRLVDGPLTFPPAGLSLVLFGVPANPYPFAAKAKELKKQYYLREITSPAARHDEIWLEAYPRSPALATVFQKLQLIFRANDMSPYAMKMVQPNGKDYIVYQFFDIAVNSPPTPGDDPFHPAAPHGWQKIVEEPPAAR